MRNNIYISMKHLKKYKLFESDLNDDADTMARYQLFDSDATMYFEFGNWTIEDPEEIKMLINKYNETVINSDQWSGGPPNEAFVEFWNKRYKDKYPVTRKNWKPTIRLNIRTANYGHCYVGFSPITKESGTMGWGGIEKEGASVYDRKVMSEIYDYLKNEIYRKLNIDETIDILGLKVANRIRWEWKDKL